MSIYTLPRDALIYLDNEKIEIEISEELLNKIRYENISRAKGILKTKGIDPMEFQNKIRAEWD